MAKKTTASSDANFMEFNFEGENGNVFSGRIYLPGRETDKATVYSLSITANGLAIVGSKFIKGNSGSFVSFPSYKDKNGEYKQQCYFYNKEDLADMSALAEHIKSLI